MLSFLHELLLLVIYNPLLLSIELLPLLLENLLAVGLMLADTIRVELATADPTRPQLGWIILDNVNPIFPIDFLDTSLLFIIVVLLLLLVLLGLLPGR